MKVPKSSLFSAKSPSNKSQSTLQFNSPSVQGAKIMEMKKEKLGSEVSPNARKNDAVPKVDLNDDEVQIIEPENKKNNDTPGSSIAERARNRRSGPSSDLGSEK